MKPSFSPIQKLFIYERREMVVLVSLCTITGLFAFTLGVHLGKEVNTRVENTGEKDPKVISTLPDTVPGNQELTGPNKATQQALEESLNQNLHDEVIRTGIHLNPAFQTELPESPKTENAGATTLKHHPHSEKEESAAEKHADSQTSAHSDETRKIASVAEPHSHSSESTSTSSKTEAKSEEQAETKTEAKAEVSPKEPSAENEKATHSTPNEPFTIQISSFPSVQEAEKRASELAHLKHQPWIKEVQIKGKGKWYRLYLGGYPSKQAAEVAGKNYVSEHKIESFIVSKVPGSGD